LFQRTFVTTVGLITVSNLKQQSMLISELVSGLDFWAAW